MGSVTLVPHRVLKAMVSPVLLLLLPLLAEAAPSNQERGLLTDLADCATQCSNDPSGFCKSGPLRLPKPCLLINAAFGTSEATPNVRAAKLGLIADLAACAIQCKLTPDGTCDSGPLGLPKPCSLINLATG